MVVIGEPASKSNSRQLVTIHGRPAFIKSKKGRAYVESSRAQLPVLDPLLTGKLKATIRIFYATERPDLDESLILDVMQGYFYKNDRQVREKHIFHAIDRQNPRAEIEIEPIEPQLELAGGGEKQVAF